jgi:membrane protease subunit HflC
MRIFVLILGVLGVGLVGLLMSAFIVDQRESVLVLRFGEPTRTINPIGDDSPGLHFRMPVIDEVIRFDRRNIDFNLRSERLTAQDADVEGRVEPLEVDAFLRYQIINPEEFYTSVGTETNARARLESIMTDALRGVIASVTTEEVVSGRRSELMERIQTEVEQQAENQRIGISVIDVRIRRVSLPADITEGVVRQMQADLQAEAERIRARGQSQQETIRAQADRVVTTRLAEAEATSQRIRGEGDAERAAIFAEAYSAYPEFYAFYRSMLAYEATIQEGTPIVVPPDSEFFAYFGSQNGQP